MYYEGRDGKKRLEDMKVRKGIGRKETLGTHYSLRLSCAKFKLIQQCKAGDLQSSPMQKKNPKGTLNHPALSSCVFTLPFEIQKEQRVSGTQSRTKNKGKYHTLGVLILRKCNFVNYVWVHDDHKTKPDSLTVHIGLQRL